MKDEINLVADECIEIFKEFQIVSSGGVMNPEMANEHRTIRATKCAIKHYEKIVDRDTLHYEVLFTLQKKGREPRELDFIHRELTESKEILANLKKRL